MALVLGRHDIDSLLEMSDLIPAVEQAQAEYSRGKAVQPMRVGMQIPRHPGSLELMPGYLEESDALAVKVLTGRRENPRVGLPIIHATILLLDPPTGRLLAILDGGSITAARTAAASGVATRYMARAGARVMAAIGTGRQARTHLWAMKCVRPIDQVRAYDLHPESAAAFKQEMESRFGIPVQLCDSAEAAAQGAAVIVLTTNTIEPVLRSDWVEPGTHINSIASATRQVREMDSELIRRAKVVVDSKEAVLDEAGDLIIPIQEGLIGPDHIHAELGELSMGTRSGRESEDEITVYKGVGLAIQDVAAARLLYAKARAAGIGIEAEL
jgi:ornithine cyclodeaminase/alanine dehydrogenase